MVVYCIDVLTIGAMFCIIVTVAAPSVSLPSDFVSYGKIGLGSDEEFGLIHGFNIIVSDHLDAFELPFADSHGFTSEL